MNVGEREMFDHVSVARSWLIRLNCENVKSDSDQIFHWGDALIVIIEPVIARIDVIKISPYTRLWATNLNIYKQDFNKLF